MLSSSSWLSSSSTRPHSNPPAALSHFAVDGQARDADRHEQSRKRTVRGVNCLRLGLSTLMLLCGASTVATSAHVLAVHGATRTPAEFLLPLWPAALDVRPAVGLVVAGAVVCLANITSLLVGHVDKLRGRRVVETASSLTAPLLAFAAALTAVALFFAVDASTTVHTLQSWSCQWAPLRMQMEPHFGPLCRESKSALYLSVLLLPLEAVTLALAAYQAVLTRKLAGGHAKERKHSPAPS